MVQNKSTPARGRPRAYEPDVALMKITEAFWLTGYSGTSLDRLCEATQMNRPSLYLAFGDKRALYIAALTRYIEQSKLAIAEALDESLPIELALKRLYALLISVYLPREGAVRGCFMLSTAVTEALNDEAIEALLSGAVIEFDRLLAARLQLAKGKGELPASIDPVAAGQIGTAVVHTLAIRARMGATRRALNDIAARAITMICGGD